jgi:hypothetical protein
VQDQVGRRLAEIGKDGLEGGPVAVDVGDDGDPHFRRAT